MSESGSCFQDFRDVAGNGCLQFPCCSIEGFQFLVERFELFLEIFVASLAQAGYVAVKESFAFPRGMKQLSQL
jgi:hypothetical protein